MMLTGERRQQVIETQTSKLQVATARRASPDTKKVWSTLDPKQQAIVILLTVIMTLCSILCYKPNTVASFNERHVSHLYDNQNTNQLDDGDKLAKLSGDITENEPVYSERQDEAFQNDLIGTTTSSTTTSKPTSAKYSTIQFDDQIEDQEEGDHEFFTKNPVDQKSSNESSDFDKEVDVNDLDFNDFYDHAYKNSFKFDDDDQSVNATSTSTNKRLNQHKNMIKINSPQEHRTAASVETLGATRNGAVECATVLARGTCLTYGLIEWAIRVARRWLAYSRPGGLSSSEPRESTINSVGELTEFTTRALASRLQLTAEEIGLELENIDMSRTSLWYECPRLFRALPLCSLNTRYRTHTGQCNNPFGTHLGSSNMPFVRSLPPHYHDDIGLPRMTSTSNVQPLPSARLVALNLHPGIERPSEDHSVMFMSWGQLLNHDLALASGARPATGHGRPCCHGGTNSDRDRTCMPIGIGLDDPVYGPFGVRCHEFKRSLAGLRPGCSLGARTQLNTITSFIDASFVYGSTYSMMRSIRGTRRGNMAMWNYFSSLKPLLPPQRANPDEECVNRRGRFCFLSGDARTNQQVQLVALHTIHTRQHNRLAGALAQLNPHWPSERIYHEARHIHIAMVQHILLAEYLPNLLGTQLCSSYNLTEAPPGQYWDHYDASLNPGVSQSFAAAAFRQGHSTVPSQVFRFNSQHEPVRVYQLRHLFRQPWVLFEPWAMDEFLLGMVDAPAQQLDPFVSDELSGHLLQMPGELVGLDLVAINIQRGRDQGLPGYNAFRDWCGLGRVGSFDELEGQMSNRSVRAMSALYEDVDDIDLFSGGLSEFPLEGAQVGPTFACIIGRQFSAVRAGDRFWFESSLGPHAFSPAQLDSIRQTSLARLVCANSDNILTIQQMALQMPHPILNPRLDCHSLPDLDISLWFEPRPTALRAAPS